ncbi:MAG TPA: gamma-glutamylcyclotransferase family protein [Acetobacteraceae bacterium]|jgi:cation transport regulator ChaC|nr:gamma-glutamylcyclotransferase family protein [Acetobacteraceae bacterium]
MLRLITDRLPNDLRRTARIHWRRLAIKSWALARWHYRWHGHELLGRPSEPVWYFAYGSNMHHSAFRERRRMKPTEWRVGRLQGYRLRFNLEGRPIGKAAPANICSDGSCEVWGVLYRITRRELLRLDSTEGVPGRNYRHILVPVEDANGNMVTAVTYMAKGREADGRPSRRYITLLRDGARAHGLPAVWLEFLDSVQHGE